MLLRNPEGFARSERDPKHLFNKPCNDGKTILYVACQQGKVEIVDFFVQKNYNVHVKSKIDNKYESCLQVACRWNYYSIVNLLLKHSKFIKKEITESLGYGNEAINKMLKSYLNDHFKSEKVVCYC